MTTTEQPTTTFRFQVDTDRFERVATFQGWQCRSGEASINGGKRAKFFAEDTIASMAEVGRHAILVTIPTPGCYYEPNYEVWGERA